MEIITLQTGKLSVNTYLLIENGKCVVVDPGGDAAYILSEARRRGAQAEWVLLTHAHFDHTGGVQDLVSAGLRLAVGKEEENALNSPTLSLTGMVGLPTLSVRADKTVTDGERFTLCDVDFTALHTPGHTEGSYCYLTKKGLLSGDTLFCGSYGRTDFPGGSGAKLKRSIQKLFDLEGDMAVYPGHEDQTTLSFERKYNPILGV